MHDPPDEREEREVPIGPVLDVLLRATHADLITELRGAMADLGVHDCDVMVVDYAQEVLTAVDSDQHRCQIDSSSAGESYMHQIICHEPHGEDLRVWIPVSDGACRIGVLRLDVGIWDGRLETAALRIAGVIAKKLTSDNHRTDLFTQRRRQQHMTLGSEMQWQLLPPTSYVTSAFEIAGILEPAYENGGDAFDYAHNDGMLAFSVMDAMGHGTEASFLSSATTVSLRHSRTCGLDLHSQYRAADETIEKRWGNSYFATAILARFDVATRRMTWISAGHPAPLLVRNGEVTEMVCHPSLPLGLGGKVNEIARRTLEPDDIVVLYTDGVSETRHQTSPSESLDVLEQLVLDVVMQDLIIAETMRRLSFAVLELHKNDLRDDATMMLLRVR